MATPQQRIFHGSELVEGIDAGEATLMCGIQPLQNLFKGHQRAEEGALAIFVAACARSINGGGLGGGGGLHRFVCR